MTSTSSRFLIAIRDFVVYLMALLLLYTGFYFFEVAGNPLGGVIAVLAAFTTSISFIYFVKWRPIALSREVFEQVLLQHKFDQLEGNKYNKEQTVNSLRGCKGFGDFHISVDRPYFYASDHLRIIAGQYTATGEGWHYGMFVLIIYDYDATHVGREFDRWFSETGRMRQLLKGTFLPVHQGINSRLVDIPSTEIRARDFGTQANLLVENITSLASL